MLWTPGVLWCVNPTNKTLAFGLDMFLLGLCGWLPAPTVFGMVIDTTCSVWENIGGGIKGSCWEYDIVAPRYRIQGFSAVLRCAQFACYCIVYIIGRNKFEFWERQSMDNNGVDEKIEETTIGQKMETNPEGVGHGIAGISYVQLQDEHHIGRSN